MPVHFAIANIDYSLPETGVQIPYPALFLQRDDIMIETLARIEMEFKAVKEEVEKVKTGIINNGWFVSLGSLKGKVTSFTMEDDRYPVPAIPDNYSKSWNSTSSAFEQEWKPDPDSYGTTSKMIDEMEKQLPKRAEEKEMSESTSRYSIVENLTRDKNAAQELVNQLQRREKQLELDYKRYLEDQAEIAKKADDARNQAEQRKKEDLELFKTQAKIEIEFQNAKVAQLDGAIKSIEGISKAVEKTKPEE